jgi:RimJ/RimL family protein N-acetyltransferase
MIETDRLIIRPFKIDDAYEAQKWFHDVDVMRWIPNGPDKSFTQTKNRIQKYIDHYLIYGFSKFIIIDKNSNQPIGDAGLMKLDGTEFIELGYRLKKEYWGMGIATETASNIIKNAFQVDKLENIHAIIEPENIFSIHIITNKLNFEYVKQDMFFGEIFNLYRLDKEKFREI